MAIPSSVTDNYEALLSTTLRNFASKLVDNISTSNKLFFFLRRSGGYTPVRGGLGYQIAKPIMHALGSADSYAGYDELDTTPVEGISTALYDWRQASVPITISRIEERKNAGEHKIIDLLNAKVKQAQATLQDYFGRSLLQGQGANDAASLTTARTSASNGSTFIEPLFKLIADDTSASLTVGNIDQSVHSFWRNQQTDSTGSSFAAILKELRLMYQDCEKGVGGGPNLHITDENTFALYETALASSHRNPSYTAADIPFQTLGFKGSPVVWDEFMPDVSGGSTTLSTTSGTWAMINTNHLSLDYDPETNFLTTDFVRPENQDAKTAQILWYGQLCTDNRRKNGALCSIDTTVSS